MMDVVAAGMLASYAAQSEASHGRVYAESVHSYRGEYQRDRDRVIHSSAFRRLVYKTQVFVNHEGDLYRTRLTHSLEVGQIARTVAARLKLNEQLVEAICLAHDVGHTPFGHAGQDALNRCMQDFGGFEHNLQSLRVVDELEEKYADFPGLNLTFETREGILKHCSKRNARNLGELGMRFINRKQPGLEAQLANLADAIAYNNHDVDDGLRSGLITVKELQDVPLFGEQHQEVMRCHPQLEGRAMIHETVRAMINLVVTDLIDTTAANLAASQPESIDAVRNLPPQVLFSESMLERHLALKRFLNESLYRHEKVVEM
ncbi:MAG: deoxyguanosinetriphosphate triphosphohydrolase, partial [Gammaproteobacteria bacterium]|nr:deoxyguanosinetriphosphate triphosphohydrolase [Gammaproteobacteria bacterium]